MWLIIDGYNLLYAVGIVGRGIGPGGLARSRKALLNFLAESLDPAEVPHATIVFDARQSPPGLPRVADYRGLTVRFAAQYEDADSLIEELVRAHSAPRRLTVVSSDHRVQKAARRRRAEAVDADVWYAATVRRRRERRLAADEPCARPSVPLLEEDVHYWLRQFGGETDLERLIDEENAAPEKPGPCSPHGDDPPAEKPLATDNPFPPGYGEDLLREDAADEE